MSREVFRSSVYTNRPAYADYDALEKFRAIQGIIITRLKQHPKANRMAEEKKSVSGQLSLF